MARHEDDLELYMRVMVDSQPWLADPGYVQAEMANV
jgi:hypothetical protein